MTQHAPTAAPLGQIWHGTGLASHASRLNFIPTLNPTSPFCPTPAYPRLLRVRGACARQGVALRCTGDEFRLAQHGMELLVADPVLFAQVHQGLPGRVEAVGVLPPGRGHRGLEDAASEV